MAILSGAATADQTHRILERLTTDTSLHRTRLMQSFYLARALEAAGAYERVPTHVYEPWRAMLGSHLTTWCEYWPGRSDCHAWSSWPAYDFVTRVLGIRPAAPGFGEVLVRPQTAGADWAKGCAPTPAGPVHVEWRRDERHGRGEAGGDGARGRAHDSGVARRGAPAQRARRARRRERGLDSGEAHKKGLPERNPEV